MDVAVVGVGFMGSNHVRVLDRIRREGHLDVEIKYLVDVDYERAKRASKLYGGEPLRRVEDIKGGVDVAVVATPTRDHYETVVKLAGMNVGFILVEKPLTAGIHEASKLIEVVERNGVEVSVGYVERFNPAVLGLMKEAASGGFRDVLTVFSRRSGPYSTRVRDVDVTLDLGSHEFDIHLLINRNLPNSLRAYGLSNVVSNLVDHAWIHMDFGETLSFIETSRLSPVKLRELYVTTRRALYALNYIEQKLVIINAGYEVNVKVKREEPLFIEDLVNLAHYAETKKALVDVYQAFSTQLLCHLAKLSVQEGRDVRVKETEEFIGIAEEGLKRMNTFYAKLAGFLEKFSLV